MYQQLDDEDVSDDKATSRSPVSSGAQASSESALNSKTLADSYGSTARQTRENERTSTDTARRWRDLIPCRICLYVLACLGLFCTGCLRSSVSVAVVAMVNSTTTDEQEDRNSSALLEGQCPLDDDMTAFVRARSGQLDWDRNEQALVLAAVYYGNIITQIPGGWLADRFGGKWLLAEAVLVPSIVSLLTPAAAVLHVGVVVFLRVIAGLGEGVTLPSVLALMARWSPPTGRSIATVGIAAGWDAGTVVGMLLGGVLSQHGFAGGWPSIFYVFGLQGCVWFIVWSLLCYSSPEQHPRISAAERLYLETAIGPVDSTSHPATPWRQILTSVPVWALTAVYFANLWAYYTVLSSLPLFLHDIFHTSMTRNGVLSSLPFMLSVVVALVSGIAADWLRTPGRLSTTFVRKMFAVLTCVLVTSFFMTAVHVGCDLVEVEATMIIGIGSLGLGWVYYLVNQLDLAPLHAGKLLGLTHAIALLAAVGGPHVVGALTHENPTLAAWQVVFYIVVAVLATGTVIFCVFGSGERQKWADEFEQQLPISKQVPTGKLQSLSNLKTAKHSEH